MEKVYKFYSLERWFYQHKMTVLAVFVRAHAQILGPVKIGKNL